MKNVTAAEGTSFQSLLKDTNNNKMCQASASHWSIDSVKSLSSYRGRQRKKRRNALVFCIVWRQEISCKIEENTFVSAVSFSWIVLEVSCPVYSGTKKIFLVLNLDILASQTISETQTTSSLAAELLMTKKSKLSDVPQTKERMLYSLHRKKNSGKNNKKEHSHVDRWK